MKKFFLNIFLFCLAAVVIVGCKPDEPNPDPQPTDSVNLTAQSIAEGAEVDAFSVNSLTLTYNKMLKLSASAKVTVNDQAVTPTVSTFTVTVPLELEAGSQYTVSINAGAFVSKVDETLSSPAFTLHFTTKAAATTDSIDQSLSNPNATQQAQNVYAFLLSQYGKKMLSASMANVNWNFNEADLVYSATGKHPAIATMDYIHLLTQTSHNPYQYWKVAYDNTTDVENWWNNNGLIAASWHWNMPATQNDINNPDGYTCTPGTGSTGTNLTTCAKPSNVMKDGTWEKTIADDDLATMARLLKLLQDKNIPVIFRPLHEASGNTYGQYAGGGAWFWWGIEGAEVYKQLWRYVYDYLKDAGVNNLIWVWTSQNDGDTDWYPGDEYVDIIGQDIYTKTASECAAEYERLRNTYSNKIVTLSECGSVGLLSEQWADGARWSYCMPWYQYDATTLDNHEHANTAWWTDAMSSPYVISREDMPSLK